MRGGLSFEEAERAQREQFRSVAAAICEGRNDQEVLDRLENRLRIDGWRQSGLTGPRASSPSSYRPTIGRSLAL